MDFHPAMQVLVQISSMVMLHLTIASNSKTLASGRDSDKSRLLEIESILTDTT